MLALELGPALAAVRTIAQIDEIARVFYIAWCTGEIGDADGQAGEAQIIAARHRIQPRARPQAGVNLGAAVPTCVRRLRRPRSPDRKASLERRRRCATSGAIPSTLAAHFPMAQLAALAIIAGEVRKCQRCTLPIDAIASKAGVSRTSVQDAVRAAERLGLIRREERRRPGAKSWTNVVEIIGPEWRAWLRLAPERLPPGLKKPSPTNNGFFSYGYDGRNRAKTPPPRMMREERQPETQSKLGNKLQTGVLSL